MHGRALVSIVLALASAATLAACGSESHPAAVEGGIEQAHEGGVITFDPCAGSTEQGCPCEAPDASAACQAKRQVGDYTSCEPGLRYCGDDGKWGVCVGPGVAP